MGLAACLVSIRGLSYLAVRSDPNLQERCEAAVVDAIGCDPDGLALEAHVVEVMGGMSICQFAVVFRDWVTQQELQIHLTRTPALGKLIETRMTMVPGVDVAMARGDVVCEVSSAANEGLVRFQGTWVKDTSTYVIRGTGIRFPSGGRAEMITHGRDKFSITHPSGVSFNAVLENHGLELRWTNGSTWARAVGRDPAGEPAAATVIPMTAPHGGSHVEASIEGDHQSHHQHPHEEPDQPSEEPVHDLSALGAEVGPVRWGITGAQCKALLDDLRMDPLWNPRVTVEQMVQEFIIPRTEAAHIGYALLVNQEDPQQVTSMVLHAPNTSGAEVLATIARSASEKEVFFVAALSKPQIAVPEPAEEVTWVRRNQESTDAPKESPEAAEEFAPEEEMQVLEHIQAQRKSQWCSRLCCGPMPSFPLLLVALSVILFYGPIITWGCVPGPDFSRCGARVPAQDLSWSSSTVWFWMTKYQEDWDKLPEISHFVRSFTYLAVAGLLVFALLIWLLHRRFRPTDSRVLVIPGHCGKKRHDLGLGRGPSLLALDADSLQVPVVIAPGVTAPKRVKRVRTKKGADGQEVVVTEFTEATQEATEEDFRGSGGEMDAIQEGFNEDGSPITMQRPASEPASVEQQPPEHEEEKPEEKVLRIAALKLRWSQSRAVFLWALLLLVLRTADLSLALAGKSRWQDAVCALAGVVLGVFASVAALHYAVRHWRGKLPLCVACAFPGGLLICGAAVLSLLAYVGLIRAAEPTFDAWVGFMDLATDEAARYVNPQVCNTVLCKRMVAVCAGFAQTLLVAGSSVFIVAFSALFCRRRCHRRSHWAVSSIIIVTTLVSTIALALTRAAYVAGGLGNSVGELPQGEFGFTAAVYMVTQALARCAAPVCLLIRLGSQMGVQVLTPRCCGGRRAATA